MPEKGGIEPKLEDLGKGKASGLGFRVQDKAMQVYHLLLVTTRDDGK